MAFVPKLLTYMDPDYITPEVLMCITSLVKDIVFPNRKLILAPYQPVILKALLRSTRNKMMFFDDNTYASRSQMDRRLDFIKEYASQHSLDFTASAMRDDETTSVVALLFHTECVEILALCCEEMANHVNPKLSSLLTVDTLLNVMTNEEVGSASCPPLMYSYGLFLYRVYLRNSNTNANVFNCYLVSFLMSQQMWPLIESYCIIAGNPSSLTNSFRPFIFDVVLPTVELALKLISSSSKLPGHNAQDEIEKSRKVRGLMQSLLRNLLSASMTFQERFVVEGACLYFNVSFNNVAEDTSTDVQTDELSTMKSDGNGFSDIRTVAEEEEEIVIEYEMANMGYCTDDSNFNMSGDELLKYTNQLVDHCPEIERLCRESSTQKLVSLLTDMEVSPTSDRPDPSSSSVSSDYLTEQSISSIAVSGAIFSPLIRRLTMYSMKVIASIQGEECSQDSIGNVKLVFSLFITILSNARGKSMSDLEYFQHLMNKHNAGQLIVEIISLAHSDKMGRTRVSSLVDCALEFSLELLYNGNRQCQMSMLGYMRGNKSLRLHSFFSSITKTIKNCSEVMRSMIHSRNGIKEVDMSGDVIATARSEEHYLEVLSKLKATFQMLQLLCEGHNHDIQVVFENTVMG